MKTIWKYTLSHSCEIDMPAGAELLSVHEQDNKICLWALVDTNAEFDESRRLVVVGTGHPMPNEPMRFLGAAHLMAGEFVFHVFEVCEK